MTTQRRWKGNQGTGIEWCHFPPGYLGTERWRGETWNPSVGCTRVSDGCLHCFAYTLHDFRYAKNLATARKASNIDVPHSRGRSPSQELIAAYRESGTLPRLPFPAQYDRPFSTVQLLDERIAQPLHWREPRSVFVDSMADLFHEDVPDEYIDRVFATMAATPRHVYMILTKRPDRMRDYINDASTRERVSKAAAEHFDDGTAARLMYGYAQMKWPLPGVWLGTSVESQDVAAERLDALLATQAALHFVSAEPLLGPLDLRPWLGESRTSDDLRASATRDPRTRVEARAKLSWVLVGGESGESHRPLDLAWVESLREQCRMSGAAYFGKQRAAFRPGQPLPDGLDVHEFPAEPPVRALG